MSFDVGVRAWDVRLIERLQLSSGVTFYPHGPRFGQQLYIDRCFLAREDWRACDEDKARALTENCIKRVASSIVEVISLDAHLVEGLRTACPANRRLDDASMHKPPFADLLALLASKWCVMSELHPLGYA